MHQFSPYLAFKRLDRYDKDHLTSRDFQLFLNDNYTTLSELESYDLMKSFDKSGMGRVSFKDFHNGILPSYSEVLRDVAGSRPSYRIPPYDPLPYRVERGLANLLNSELRLQRQVALLRGILRRRQDFTPSSAFRSIASSKMCIYLNDIRDLFRKCRTSQLLPSEQQAIMRRLDQDGDGRLSFNQFYDALCQSRPQLKSPKTSYAYQRSSPSPVKRMTSYSPSPYLRSYRESESPFRRSFRISYNSPIRRSYLDPIALQYSPPRSPLRQIDDRASRRAYQPSISYQPPPKPLKQEQNYRNMINGNAQPYEYSPLRGFTPIREYPNSTSYQRPNLRQDDKYQSYTSPFRISEEQYSPSYNYNQKQIRIEQNKIKQPQEKAWQSEQAQDKVQIIQDQGEVQQAEIDSNQYQKQRIDQQNQFEDLQAANELGYHKEPDVLQFPMDEQGQALNQGQYDQRDHEKLLQKQSNDKQGQDSMQRPAYQDTPPIDQNQPSSAYFNTPPQQLRGQSLKNSDPMASSTYYKQSPEKQ